MFFDVISHVTDFLWDSLFTAPLSDFYFKVELAKPQKEREITQRDYLGRIVSSKVSELTCPTP